MSNAIIKLGLPLSAALMFGASTIAQTSQPSQTRPAQPQQSQTQRESPQSRDAADFETFRGCVERDPSARGQIGASQQTGAEQTALLKKASSTSHSSTSRSTRAGETPQQTARRETGSATAPSGARADASEHRDGKDGDAGTFRLVAPRESSFELVTFIGQQVEVRGTINPQPVPRDEVDDEKRPARDQAVVAPPSTDFDDAYKALKVTTITKIADSCDSN